MLCPVAAIDAKERQHWVNRLRATAEYHTEHLTHHNPGALHAGAAPTSTAATGATQRPQTMPLNRQNSGSIDSLTNPTAAPPAR